MSVSIHACLIVRNEAQHIGECINTVWPHVNGITVLDTGSSDDTPNIARRLGAKVYRNTWRDSFAEARQECLAYAPFGAWILQIDADERLFVHGKLSEFLDTLPPDTDGLQVKVHSLISTQQPANLVTEGLRMFKNVPGLIYEGRCHEHLTHPVRGKAMHLVSQDVVRLVHLGYVPEWADQSAKRQRNLRLLSMDYDEHPESEYVNFCMARALEVDNRLEEAKRFIGEAERLWREHGSVPYLWVTDMHTIYSRLNVTLTITSAEPVYA